MDHESENLQRRLETSLKDKESLQRRLDTLQTKIINLIKKESKIINWIDVFVNYIERDTKDNRIYAIDVLNRIENLLIIMKG